MTRTISLFFSASLLFAGCADHDVEDTEYSSDSGFGGSGGADDDEVPDRAAGDRDSDGGSTGDGFELNAARCGDGEVDTGEECDLGDENADEGACTGECRWAACGDGLVYAEGEDCDNGDANGEYDASGHCTDQCTWADA